MLIKALKVWAKKTSKELKNIFKKIKISAPLIYEL